MVQRRMADTGFRSDQRKRCFDPHVAAINRLVEQLRRRTGRPIPFVAPLYGGVNAGVLFLLQDPGPGTDDLASGSGFLCPQNDDPTAELFADCLDATGLDVSQILGWNAYPWMLDPGQNRPNAQQLDAGVNALRELLALTRAVQSVILMGRVAEKSWRRFKARHPELASRYSVFVSPHPSRRGITGGGKYTRQEGIVRVKRAMLAAMKASAQPSGLSQ